MEKQWATIVIPMVFEADNVISAEPSTALDEDIKESNHVLEIKLKEPHFYVVCQDAEDMEGVQKFFKKMKFQVVK